MVLIIRDELVDPPTWFSSFLDLTLICSMRLRSYIVIETEHTDTYYNWLKSRGGMAFVDDFVAPVIEAGIRLDTEPDCESPIIVDRIVPENTNQLYQ